MTTYGYGYYNFYQQNDEAKRLIYNGGIIYRERVKRYCIDHESE